MGLQQYREAERDVGAVEMKNFNHKEHRENPTQKPRSRALCSL